MRAFLFVFLLCLSVVAQDRIGVVNLDAAMFVTNDGREAAERFRKHFQPRQDELEKLQSEILKYQSRLATRCGSDMDMLAKEDAGPKRLYSEYTRLNLAAEVEASEYRGQLLPLLRTKLSETIRQYAEANGLALVLDSSNPQVHFGAIDITPAVVDLYNKTH